MRVFISWSGEPSRTVAIELEKFIRLVLPQADPWVSASHIAAGGRWGVEVAKALEETSVGILCITQENQHSPWLLFEAGACAKRVENTFVCPYLIGMTDGVLEDGPLTQFQARTADRDGTKEVVAMINRALAGKGRPQSDIDTLFDKLWPIFGEVLEQLPKNEAAARRSTPEMLEDILTSVRALARREQTVSRPVSKKELREMVFRYLEEPHSNQLRFLRTKFIGDSDADAWLARDPAPRAEPDESDPESES